MSFSCCCIASDIPANREALDNKGLIYPLNDYKALQKQMEYVIEHAEKRQLIGQNLLAHVYKNYTWSFIANEFIKLYNTNLSVKYKDTTA